MYKLLGYENKAGDFTNKQTGELIQYDNYVLHFVTDERTEVKGLFCGSAKTKREKLQFMGFKTLDDILGKEVIFGFDMTGGTPVVNRIIYFGKEAN